MNDMPSEDLSQHDGLSRECCLGMLERAALHYTGESVPTVVGRGEHRLHYAVRLVESYEEGGSLPMMIAPLWARVCCAWKLAVRKDAAVKLAEWAGAERKKIRGT